MRLFLVLVFIAFAHTARADSKPVTVTGGKLVLRDQIYFDSGKATIKSQSFTILDAVVATLVSNKKIGLVEIGVHTDARGDSKWNLELSEARAQAIYTYLVDKGIETKRLRAKGYGESRPLDKGSNAAAWAKNRRTEFVIVQTT